MSRHFSSRNHGRTSPLVTGVALALAVTVSTFAGVVAQDATPAASPATAAKFAEDAAEGMTFGLIQKSGDQEYFVEEAQGFTEAIEAAGADVVALNTTNSDFLARPVAIAPMRLPPFARFKAGDRRSRRWYVSLLAEGV